MSEFQKPWVREIRDEEWSRIFGGPNRVRDRVHGPESEREALGKPKMFRCPYDEQQCEFRNGACLLIDPECAKLNPHLLLEAAYREGFSDAETRYTEDFDWQRHKAHSDASWERSNAKRSVPQGKDLDAAAMDALVRAMGNGGLATIATPTGHTGEGT